MKVFIANMERMKIEDISLWRAFNEVVVQGNFSRAAKTLNCSLPQISKKISRLEDQLGHRLFHRTTRSMRPTEEAIVLAKKVQPVLQELSEIEDLFEPSSELRGNIKMTCVPFIAHRLMIPLINTFAKQHPKVHIQLDLSEKFTNIIEGGYDLAIRIEEPKDSDFIYRKLVPNELVLCASPGYLDRLQNRPKKPEDLLSCDLLMMSIHHRCRFKSHKMKLADLKPAKLLTCENGSFLSDLARQGAGILVRSYWDVAECIQRGDLVQVLPKFELETFGHVYAVTPQNKYMAPRVRTLIDEIVSSSKAWGDS